MEAATHWGEDSRFAQCETDVSYRHYAEPEHRFISQVQERYIRRDLASVLVWPAAAACAGGSHLLIPGLNFALDYLEVLEAPELRDALLLGTVLEALRSGARSKREYRRLREAAAAPSKHFGVFHNRHCSETFVPRRAGEGRAGHAMREAAEGAAWASRRAFLSFPSSPTMTLFHCTPYTNDMRCSSLGVFCG
jgi:hypothetical protein